MRKKVDERIITLIENGVKTRHRSMFIIVGDKAIHQIANLHHLMGKAALDKPKAGSDNKSPRTVLWCYKDKLDFSSHEKKRAKQIEKKIQRGLFEPDKADAFALFLKCVKMTHCRYKDSEKVLGNTYGMCILQDFEALTPNLLARTLETVEGGGLIVLLLRSLPSLTSLYTMTMDVHERFRTESHKDKATGRFNERFLLSLASCKACIVMDDELNILPISSHIRSIKPTSVVKDAVGLSETQSDSKNLREQLNDDDPVGPVIKKCGTVDQCKNDDQGLPETQRDLTSLNEQLDGAYPVGPLIRKCCTFDQGKSVITFLDAILDKTLRSTIALLSARGRGKSAALGLAIAGAIASGYSNIYVTAPSPDNVKTLFEFVCKGFNALDYKESADYQVVKSSNSEFKQAIVRLDIYKQHRQTIQYIQPNEHVKLSQVELLVIDEAAAIPLPVVKSMLGPYLVFLSSTVNGYEGTGRSLSLKLLQQLQQQSLTPNTTVDDALSGRVFKKVELSESIRYASGDPVESWLYNLLCLGATSSIPNINRLPPTNECDLYYVDRDTLFSYHNKSELFLQRMMALYVASHYKNSPNDLQLMADAPAHHLFVLLGPVDESRNDLPDILCVLQVCLEGQISLGSAIKSLSEGHSPSGDQIPWKFCEQFQETYFPSLSGARIVRIAVHPSAMRLGYGSTAVELLTRYYEGQFTPIAEVDVEEAVEKPVLKPLSEAAKETSLLKEDIKPRANLPPLLVHLRERKPERLNYIGVSFGLTIDLFRFWSKHKFMPFYVGHIPSTTTGEHTCMGIKPFSSDDVSVGGSSLGDFLSQFYRDFRRRFTRLLCSSFQGMEYKLAMSILDPKINFREHEPASSPSNGVLTPINDILSPLDKKRLKAYADNLVDFHMILDLVPILAHQYFEEKLPVTLSYVQASLLLCMGLQNHDVTYVEGQMKLERQQILSLFIKVMRKFSKCLYDTASKEIESNFSRRRDVVMEPLSVSLDEDLNEGARQVMEKMRAETKGSMNPDLLQQYAIRDEEGNFEKALQNGEVKIPASGLISVKTNRNKVEKHGKQKDHKRNDKRSRDGSESHSNKKKKS